MKKIVVFGHKNPDTDSVCGAITLSYLKNQLLYITEPRILGDLNNETKFALDYFGVKAPQILEDVKVKIKDIKYHKDYYIREDASIFDTYHSMNKKNITGIPLVDDNKKFVGYVSLKEIAHAMIDDTTNYLDTTFNNIISTLNSENFIQIDNDIKGNIIAVTFDDSTFINNIKLDESSIVIVGDRKHIIDYSIEKKVKLIILIGNQELNDEQIINAKNNNVNIICTPFSSFETSKLLGLTNKINTIKRNEHCICLDVNDYMTDFIEISNKTKHTNYPIVNKKGICYGMLRLIDINEYDKYKVILVDHNESRQSVDGLDEAEVLEIVDHHNISDINTNKPINFRNMAVGSVNTIIYYLYKENNITIPNYIAGLMLSGIISDTVLLNSPTTTYHDKLVVEELSKQIGIDKNEYGMELLKSGMSLDGEEIEDIIYRDYKTYSVNGYRFSVGQVLTVDFKEFEEKKNEYVEVLNDISRSNGYKLSALFVTNILTKESYVLYNDSSKDIIEDAFNLNDVCQGVVIDGLLSRKKQIIPNIMEVLERL